MTDKETLDLFEKAEKAALQGDVETVEFIQAKMEEEIDKTMVGALIETALINKSILETK